MKFKNKPWNLKKLNEKCKNKGNAQATKSTFFGWKMCLFIFVIYVFFFPDLENVKISFENKIKCNGRPEN